MNTYQSLQDLTAEQQLALAKHIQKENKELIEQKKREKKQKLANRHGNTTTTLSIDAETLEKLKLACAGQGVSVSQAFRDFAKAYIKKHLKLNVQNELDLQ